MDLGLIGAGFREGEVEERVGSSRDSHIGIASLESIP